ncbi:uncharacterized protein LOC114522087 [Dendronephthya gigantea]|uniref:uncharacterized protein LOC114522087 n=1 Tax=Dendronephthya gigantea TaxID=151771 RepID=UPI00106CFB44|nr:uncharacterized protein LOC114522087 [Dendronephthya gigantea]
MLSSLVVFSFLLCLTLDVSQAKLCRDISGRWVNKLGSEVVLDHLQSGVLQGQYYTAVSVSAGKLLGHDILGTLPYNKPGSSFAFSVTWQNGSSTTVWTGQCMVCNGKEMLETSWLLRSHVDSCFDKWKSTRIGKDVFERKMTTVGTPEENLRIVAGNSIGHKCDLRGVWYNGVGSEIILNQTESGIISGEYRTAVERDKGSAGQSHSAIYGFGRFAHPNTTFSLIVVWRDGASVTGWVGQCHICENNTAILEMNWLLRSKVDSCIDVWKSTMYGANTFTRHEQKSGPRKSLGKHTPNRDGEDVGGTSCLKFSGILLVAILFPMWTLINLSFP